MHTIAFTGPARELRHYEEQYVRGHVAGLRASRFVSGCAYGVDTAAILYAWEVLNRSEYVLVIPKGQWYNEELEDFGFHHGWTLEYVEGGYMKRNDRLVELADELVAFPETPVPALRSGTWATVRRAQRKPIPVTFRPLTNA